MKKGSSIFSAALLIALAAGVISCSGINDQEETPVVRTSFTNPVSAVCVPDPSVIQGDDGLFYAYGSGEAYDGMPIARSHNLIDWTVVGEVFPVVHPKLDGANTGGLWAPDINKIGDKYVLYYAYAPSNSPEGWQHGIGVATADKPEGPWKDEGKLFISGEVGIRWSIDPCLVQDGGRNWMVCGSYYGIWAIELTEDGLKVKEGAERIHLAGYDGYGLEAAKICKKDGYYYLFLSEGAAEYELHYKLGAARSTSLLGPYLNKAGKDVAKGAPVDFFLAAGNGFRSPGHCSGIITDKAGTDWILYHAWVEGRQDVGRLLMLDRLTWVDGWPAIGNGVPTYESSVVPAL
ncbi:MAG: family 43 glycosylhydrolase [Bacteroidales bacterium]|nr:family 43 glycosylhydrolase [Bacteroidales bacterium]